MITYFALNGSFDLVPAQLVSAIVFDLIILLSHTWSPSRSRNLVPTRSMLSTWLVGTVLGSKTKEVSRERHPFGGGLLAWKESNGLGDPLWLPP